MTGFVDGWMDAVRHLEEYGGPEGGLLAQEMRTRFPDPPPRPGWDEYFLGIADAVSARGECTRSRVGAVLVRERRILATGYNGAAAGQPSCLDGACPRAAGEVPRGTPYDDTGPGACIAFHAEDNMISDCNARGISFAGTTAYVTKEPCERCATRLSVYGVPAVWRDRTTGRAGTLLP